MRKSALFFCFALLAVMIFFSGCTGTTAGPQVMTTSPALSGNTAAPDSGVTKTPLPENSPAMTPTTPFVRTPTTSPPVRLTSGTFLKKTIGGGFGEMRIINHFNDDAVVIITHPDSPLTARDSVYVQGGGYITVPSFPNGEYYVYVMTGNDWNATAKKFNRNAAYKKFKNSTLFASTGSRYQIWTMTIGSTDRGAIMEEVSGNNFPS